MGEDEREKEKMRGVKTVKRVKESGKSESESERERGGKIVLLQSRLGSPFYYYNDTFF